MINKDLKYLKIYLAFLKIEIPALVQILTLISFLTILGNNIIFQLVMIIVIYFLVTMYLHEKLFLFLNNEFRHYIEYDEKIKNKKIILFSLLFYNWVVALIVALLLAAIANMIVSSHLL